jgi:hypothetical protein
MPTCLILEIMPTLFLTQWVPGSSKQLHKLEVNFKFHSFIFTPRRTLQCVMIKQEKVLYLF